MNRRGYKPEQIIMKLRKAEIQMGKGLKTSEACREKPLRGEPFQRPHYKTQLGMFHRLCHYLIHKRCFCVGVMLPVRWVTLGQMPLQCCITRRILCM